MRIACRLSGMTESELREKDFRSIESSGELLYSRTGFPRQNVRFAAGMVVGRRDLDAQRLELARNVPVCLKPQVR